MTFEEWKETVGCSIKFEDEATERTAYLFADMAWHACEKQQSELIAKLEAAKPRWIPVGERLPEKKGFIAVYDRYYKTWHRHNFFPEDGLPSWASHWFELPELSK